MRDGTTWQLMDVIESLPDATFVLNTEGRVVAWNRAIEELSGVSRDSIVGHGDSAYTVPFYGERRVALIDAILSDDAEIPAIYEHVEWKGGVACAEVFAPTPYGGRGVYLWLSASRLYDANGRLAGAIETIRDITERKRSEDALREFRLLLEQARDVILRIGMDGRLLDANEAAISFYGYSRDELLRLRVQDLRPPGSEEEHAIQMEEAYARGILLETLHRRRDGELVPVEVSSRGILVGRERVLISIVRDITERKRAEAEIRHLSFHDKLTGIYNRAYVDERLHSTCEAELPFSLIMGDLNGLKVVNDAFGHAQGDELLVETARILSEACRAEDVVGRWGGDEFVILLPKADERAASAISERIRQACSRSTLKPLPPSIALGWATKSTPEQAVDQVLQQAENNMYRRKLLEASNARGFSIQSLQRSLHERGAETEDHLDRLRTMAGKLAGSMRLPENLIDEIGLLATLHDIGKIAIPDDILNKRGPLTAEEWEIMRCHPEIGYRIARTSPELISIADGISAHHERWDGRGYPRGLAGEQIPLAARILAVVDAFDAMTNDRPYRDAVSRKAAAEELQRQAGSQFDPGIVGAFVASLKETKSLESNWVSLPGGEAAGGGLA